MSAYQHSESEILPHVEVSLTIDAPKTHVVPLRRSWYSLTFSDDEDATESQKDDTRAEVVNSLPSPSCAATLQAQPDACSDASTDVGADDLDDRELVDDFDGDSEPSSSKDRCIVQCEKVAGRPVFLKLSRQQRIDQLKRVVEEFCSLDFHAVDASSQGGLVLRMLTILKSFNECAIFHDEKGRSEEKRLTLLGLVDDDADVICQVTNRADHLIQGRAFHAAFDILRELAPRLSGQKPTESKQLLSAEEVEAMKLRRLEKRQRQRGERREHRATERSERSKQSN